MERVGILIRYDIVISYSQWVVRTLPAGQVTYREINAPGKSPKIYAKNYKYMLTLHPAPPSNLLSLYGFSLSSHLFIYLFVHFQINKNLKNAITNED